MPDVERFEVARFTLDARRPLPEGARVEVSAIGVVWQGVIVVDAASVRGPDVPATLVEAGDC